MMTPSRYMDELHCYDQYNLKEFDIAATISNPSVQVLGEEVASGRMRFSLWTAWFVLNPYTQAIWVSLA